MKSNMEVSIKEKTSLNSLVGIGSKIQVDGLEETIAVVSSERSTGQKPSKYKYLFKYLFKYKNMYTLHVHIPAEDFIIISTPHKKTIN